MLKKGDIIFYTDNTKWPLDFYKKAEKAITELDLNPYYAPGVSLKSRDSHIDAEIRENFYHAKVVVMVLGKGFDWLDIGDNWAIPELEVVSKLKIKLFVYTVGQLTEQEINDLDLPISPVVVKDLDEFKNFLKKDIEQLLD